jgi:hypothetical protein
VPINRPLYNVNGSVFPECEIYTKIPWSSFVSMSGLWGTDVTLSKHNGDCI